MIKITVSLNHRYSDIVERLEYIDQLTNMDSPVEIDLLGDVRNVQHLMSADDRVFSRVRKLSFAGCDDLTDRDLDNLWKFPNLEVLDLSLCQLITDVGIANVKPYGCLREIELEGCYLISDKVGEIFGAIPTIRVIGVGACEELTDRFIEPLAQLQLEEIVLPALSEVSDVGLGILSVIKTIRSVEMSALDGVTDTGIERICQLPKLTRLILGSLVSITPVSLTHIRSAVGLRELTIQNCRGLPLHDVNELIRDWRNLGRNLTCTVVL